MKKESVKKLMPWTKRDYVLNIVVYVINFIVFVGLFAAMIYVNSLDSGTGFGEYLKDYNRIINFLVLLALIFIIMVIYLILEQRDFLKNAANSEMLFLIMELALVVCWASGKYISPFIRPIALVALLVLFLSDSRTAVFMGMIFCLIFFLFDAFADTSFGIKDYVTYAVYFLIMGNSSALIGIYSMRHVYSRFKFFVMSFLISIPCLACVAAPIIALGNEDVLMSMLYAALSGPLAAVAFTIILPFMETLFNKVSCFKYAELTNHNAKFIRKMIRDASGTFNHSMVVSNVAEACASAINEDPLLARTCAYYHDVGKIRRPEMFKENQADGVNPHDELTPELSVNIIRSHTRDGHDLIVKNRLPKEVADVCLEHHGTMPILYFYDKAKKFTDGEVDITEYCYPGPRPRSKIAAIIMIADSSEAATRALKDRSRENVLRVVKKIVNDRLEFGQFDECEITLKELNIIINATVNSLTGVYHGRVEYPKVNLENMKFDVDMEED